MTEPLSSAAAGVASALKSFRTRSGLREQRLHGTELDLDTLARLDSVQALIQTGESPEQAIVQAVKTAAGNLEPMLSIVADVSLGLELSKDAVRDPELYAGDLGQRRAALLRNWERLHELRSVPPGRAPSARALRLEVETTALNALAMRLTGPAGLPEVAREAPEDAGARPEVHQGPAVRPVEMQVFGIELARTLRERHKTIEQAAAALSLPATDVTRWARGTGLPSESQARALDGYLTARGAIQQLVIDLRSKPDQAGRAAGATPLPAAQTPTLLGVMRNVARALRGSLIHNASSQPMGWARDLRQMSRSATAASTAFGLKTLLLLEDGLAPDLVPVAENLRMMKERDGYANQEHAGPRPEATATVLDALYRISGLDHFGAEFASMEKGFDDFAKYRPYIVTIMLEASIRLKPESKLTETLIDCLLAARRPYDNALVWPEKAEPLLIAPAPSVAHTARAVRALARVQEVRPSAEVKMALEEGAAWLVDRRDLHNTYEVMERTVEGSLETATVRHFTAAWVVKALVSAGVPATHPSVSNAVVQVWASYGGDTAGLWAWDNGELPIWMTYDAVEALRLANLAVPVQGLLAGTNSM